MIVLKDFWQQIEAVWSSGVVGVSLGEVVTALLILSVFLMVRRLFFRFVISSLTVVTRRTKTNLDDLLIQALEKPLEFAFVILGLYVAGQMVPLSAAVSDFLNQTIRSLIAFMLFWTIFRSIDPLSSLLDRAIALIGSPIMKDAMKGFLIKVTKFLVICLGVAAIFQEWGFNVAAILGSLGLVGMAVALGARDFIANLFAGLTIFLDRMFEKNNWIQTPDVEGIVEDIGFRATKIRRFDKALVIIPNARLAGEALINFSRMTNRRIYWTISVEYRTTQNQLRDIIRDVSTYIHESQDFETDSSRVPTFVFVDTFGASSINIMLYCFTKTIIWEEWLTAKENLAYKVKEIIEGHGANFAFPSSSLYVETLPFGKPERFPLPEQSSYQKSKNT